MLSKLLTAAALIAASGASPAFATLDISFTDGLGHTFTCADQTSCDLDGAVKNLLLINTVVGNFRIEGSFAASTFGAPDNLSVSNLTIFNLGATTGTLRMVVGDTSFVPPVSLVRSSGSLTFNEDNGGSASFGFFADPANGQPAGAALATPGTELFTVSGNVTDSPFSFAGTKDTPFFAGTPFSMAADASLTLLPGATVTGFNQAMDATVPEPSTWAMLVIGFGAMAWGAFACKRVRQLQSLA
jgi:hypothetical protein